MMRGTMRKAIVITVLTAAMVPAAALLGREARAQEVVDRIIARVEGDVLLQSDIRELGQFQQLSGGQPEPESKRLDEMVDQWIIEHEAETAKFAQPSGTDVNAGVQQLEKDLGGEKAYEARLTETGLSDAAVKRLVRRQIFLSRYLDYKFRSSAQVDAAAEQKYYDEEFAPQMAARGQKAPPIDSVRQEIHELLVQQDISAKAAQWLTESRSQMKIEMVTPGGRPEKN